MTAQGGDTKDHQADFEGMEVKDRAFQERVQDLQNRGLDSNGGHAGLPRLKT